MNAGRELDALVAEKVMGWKHVRQVSAWDNGPDPITGGPRIGWFGQPPGDEWEGNRGQIIDNYSTGITDAWQVVEKLHQDGLWFLIEYEEQPACCYASFYAPIKESGETRSHGNAYADTAPLAICLAALQAVGGGR